MKSKNIITLRMNEQQTQTIEKIQKYFKEKYDWKLNRSQVIHNAIQHYAADLTRMKEQK